MKKNFIKNSWQKARSLYLALWTGAVVVTLIIVMTGYSDDKPGKHLLRTQDILSTDAANETINELLLSAGQLTIAEKTSFINLYLKPEQASTSGHTDNNNTDRDNVYQQILNRRINNLKSKSDQNDFSVKPVPK